MKPADAIKNQASTSFLPPIIPISDKIKLLFGNCILAENIKLAISKYSRVMSCQTDLCNSPSVIFPKLSKAVLCEDGFHI